MAPKTDEKKSADKVKSFKELASKRTQKALDSIIVLENCANKQSYTYTQEQADAIVGELAKAVARLKASFAAGGKAKSDTRFTV